ERVGRQPDRDQSEDERERPPIITDRAFRFELLDEGDGVQRLLIRCHVGPVDNLVVRCRLLPLVGHTIKPFVAGFAPRERQASGTRMRGVLSPEMRTCAGSLKISYICQLVSPAVRRWFPIPSTRTTS